jgi:hypothetical protein
LPSTPKPNVSKNKADMTTAGNKASTAPLDVKQKTLSLLLRWGERLICYALLLHQSRVATSADLTGLKKG